jgi:hypothetical protein
MVDVIWFYENNFDNYKGQRYPECPVESYEAEITKLDFTDRDRISEVVEDLEQMGADFIAVLPDFRTDRGLDYPHIAVSFPDEEQMQQCARKYTGGSYSAPTGDGSIFKQWYFAGRND